MTRLNTIADGMSALKNAGDTGKSEVTIEPASKLLGAMLRIMQDAGYIAGFEFIEDGRGGQLKVHLTGKINKCGAICPRFSVQLDEMEYWEKQYLPGKNFGLMILSTSHGVMSHVQARREGIGGELLGYVY
ncbi:ribosomal protein S8 [Methanoregula boonei 6A8]|jgi:small subunit ribosomal protein S8|uniref:Small ribosomal subunit protein uS8 n=1 Tax=Methanoregula boonei (strain DSM 21154 / JCM 14090 / 6A8) TaxID=456442 RepID=RS8_METB6|nr:30S ribosomal protein S8 [Methanoregula boonei]A7I5Q4.1 RecName: Full=Small ribosomal subunit protein uS8; AltName: Full=30S ribosomal protein S8 [Methanoregula boonei 6A8]ABS55065.1 ribosomal protein S8 [Methanoregula boonei 6A8]